MKCARQLVLWSVLKPFLLQQTRQLILNLQDLKPRQRSMPILLEEVHPHQRQHRQQCQTAIATTQINPDPDRRRHPICLST